MNKRGLSIFLIATIIVAIFSFNYLIVSAESNSPEINFETLPSDLEEETFEEQGLLAILVPVVIGAIVGIAAVAILGVKATQGVGEAVGDLPNSAFDNLIDKQYEGTQTILMSCVFWRVLLEGRLEKVCLKN